MGLYFNKKSRFLANLLSKTFTLKWNFLLEHFKSYEICIFDDVLIDEDLEEIAKLFLKKKKLLFIFKKSNLLFLGPVVNCPCDMCPVCVLLHLANTTKNFKFLYSKHESSYNFNYLSDLPTFQLDKKIICINTDDKTISRFPNLFKHPFCRHDYGIKVNNHVFGSCNPGKKSLYDKNLGIIRTKKSIHQISPISLKSKLSGFEILLFWFENPIFPLYPSLDFLELAIGTGFDYSGAYKRGLYEAVERYSSFSIPQTSSEKICTFNELLNLNEVGINPSELWDYSKVYNKKVALKKISNKTTLNWRKCTDPNGEFYFIPDDFLYVNMLPTSKYANLTTSGCAAHKSVEKAKVSAFLELIERDNTMRHWASSKSFPHVMNHTIPLPAQKIVHAIHNFGFETHIIDCSRFSGVFTFEVLLENKIDQRPKAIVVSGADIDPKNALLKTLREAFGSLALVNLIENTRKSYEIEKDKIISPEEHSIFYRDPSNFYLLKPYLDQSEYINFEKEYYQLVKSDNLYSYLLEEYSLNPYFFDLTLRFMDRDKFSVIRCTVPQLLPLTFGVGSTLSKNANEEISLTNLALNYPHPFA
ncbi:MAG: YcaO-like family protein [Candidatus Micrarchaeota archaeon]|nr:YcaO-like family protein [Candidatus Micrarchaeota archaeon]